MPLTTRVQNIKPSSTLAVSARARAMKAEGLPVISFGLGEPDFETPQNIKQAAIDALLAGDTHYSPVPGSPAARQAIAQKLLQENNIDCTSDDILITCGAKHALYIAFHALVQPGDEVILPTPCWVSYRPMVELAGGTVIEVPGAVENNFIITPEQLAAAINERTRVVLINSPSNPCGTMMTPDQLKEIAAVIAPHPNITIIADEIYEKIIYGGIKHFSLGSLPEIANRVITINGLSKAYAMTGWRVGYACAPGGTAKALASLQGQMNSHITSFNYPAVVEALTNGAEEVEKMRKVFAQRAEIAYELISTLPEVICPKPTSAFYVFPDISAYFGKTTPTGKTINTATSFAATLLEEAQVAVVPGEDFGQCAKGNIRLSFACSEKNIREGCARIKKWLQTLN